MSYKLRKIRDEYGPSYVVTFPDGISVPWRQIPLGKYVEYDRDMKRGILSLPQIEEEIFKECVLDKSFVDQLPYIKAGIVSTVAKCIWDYSGPPLDAGSLNNDLGFARLTLSSPSERALNEIIQVVTMAFPYTPDDIYGMDYNTLIFRLAQAETKLLQMGLIKEPINFEATNSRDTQKQSSESKGLSPEEAKRIANLAKSSWENKQPANKGAVQGPTPSKKKKDWKISPVLEKEAAHDIDFSMERAMQDTFLTTGHEKTDLHLSRDKLVKDAQWIYKDLISELEKKYSNKKV